MNKFLIYLLQGKRLLYIVIGLLAIVPFFWFSIGEMDLGGDATRLYFYDPLSYFKNYSLYSVEPLGTGRIETNFYILPVMMLFFVLKSILFSPYLVITLFNSFKLVVGFLAIYLIVNELNEAIGKKYNVRGELAGILAGLFYVFQRGMITQWNLAYLSHDQIFLNPLMFYFILKFLLTGSMRYLWSILMVSFIFAHSFAWASAPAFFSFYPLAIVFLLVYTIFIRKRKLPWKGILVGLIIFLGLHLFHLLPAVNSLFDAGSNTNTRIFNKDIISQQLNYFFGVLGLASLSNNILLPSFIEHFSLISVAPFVVLLGFLIKKSQKAFLLTGAFFLITFYLLSAKIGDIGIKFYTLLFLYVPAFSMFRNFIFQWLSVYSFFYAILFGLALFLVLSRLSKKYVLLSSLIIGILFIISAWPFINGSLVKKVLYTAPKVQNAMIMDPKYEEALAYIKALPDDSKILTLPFSDYNYQVVHGTNNGAYMGLSTIAFLAGKKDFSGYATIAPFSDAFINLAKEKNYEKLNRILGLLNIRYIYYNKDPLIYDTTLPTYPYGYVRNFLPSNQKGYEKFVDQLSKKKMFERGSYALYKTEEKSYLPHFYVPDTLVFYKNNPKLNQYASAMSFFNSSMELSSTRSAFIDSALCSDTLLRKMCKNNESDVKNILPKIFFEKINPTKYRVKVLDAHEPFVLVFSEAFNVNWKAFITKNNSNPLKKLRQEDVSQSYFDGYVKEGNHKSIFFDGNTFEALSMETLNEDKHFQINGYANGWYISPSDSFGRRSYELVIEMTSQRVFYIGLLVSFIFFVGCIVWGFILFKNNDSK